MADVLSDSRRCNYFFLYDGSKVKEEGDPTREGICYFYPEETPIDKQELLCGQLAGVGRCISEISSSPVRVLKLRRSKFAIRMKEDLFWALGCSVDIPTVSVCELLDQLINLFCFYNGSVRQSYQINSRETLAVRWAHYLSHLQGGSREFHHIFSCLRTIDSTNIDPLLLLKAALILQACQRCPLVLAGCILFRGRVVSTQMPPDLTIKVMVYESETYNKEQWSNELSSSGSSGSIPLSSGVTFTTVFLTTCELQCLRSSPVDRETRSDSTLNKDSSPQRTCLSRTLSDTPSICSDPSGPDSSQFPIPSQDVSYNPLIPGSDNLVFSPSPSQNTAGSLNSLLSQTSAKSLELLVQNGKTCHETEEDTLEESCYHSFYSNGGGNSLLISEGDSSLHEETSPLNGQTGSSTAADGEMTVAVTGSEDSHVDKMVLGDSGADSENIDTLQSGMRDLPPCSSPEGNLAESPLVPMTLYQHRVKGLVLALLVEPQFLSDTTAMKEVYHSSLASLNGLEAHLRTVSPVAPGPQDLYIFAHFDCIQNTLTTNLSGPSGGVQERSFVRGTSLLHSHFYNTGTLQEAILRNAGAAVYGTRSVAQETYFLQHGGTVRNSGIPNHQDSAFSLPSKARHRLLKHGVNLFWRDMTEAQRSGT
ncbi:Hermansky-Pudlak syndrome 4 protein [Lampris incognitus]|uniref:Hermansky-Pudlak syndrome 4 protein n=1 Tax=Lampris incognitus TaxID=2546036 RepID=UPI0024B5CAA9|nr:Hermansky-Pudlak syndrome 4 protein [Lampris incognitus]